MALRCLLNYWYLGSIDNIDFSKNGTNDASEGIGIRWNIMNVMVVYSKVYALALLLKLPELSCLVDRLILK